MATFEVRPITSQTTPDYWSHVLILSDPIRRLDVSAQPIWLIALSLSGESSGEKGPMLLEALNNAYQQIELKIPEALYQTLTTHFNAETNASVAAICFTLTKATIMGKGNFKTQLYRENRQSTILNGDDHEWHIVEGEWKDADRWSLTAGKNDESTSPDLRDLDQATATLHDQLALRETDPSANILVSCNAAQALPSNELEAIGTEVLPPAPSELRDPKVINKRRVMAVGWIILILLIVSVFFGARARAEKISRQNFTNLENQANQSIATARELKSVDQVKARSTLRELQNQLAQSKSLFVNDKKWIVKWEVLNTSVNTAYQEIAGEASVEDLPEWFALSVVKPGFKGDQLGLSGTNLVILDKNTSTLVKIATDTKRAEVVTGGETINGATYFTIDGNRVIIITDSGIKEVSLSRKTTATLIEKDADWKSPQTISLFNGNVYLLDSSAGEIWRYPGTTTGVGSKQRWLGQGVTIPTTDIVDMAVDGDLWILQKIGTIKRFRRGASVGFSFSGLDNSPSATTSFSVSGDQDNIAILDGANQRVIRINKEGVYQKQFKWNGLTEAQSVALSPDGNTIYILKNGSIYTANF